MHTKLFDKRHAAQPGWVVVALVVIILVASVLRLWHLNILPPGLFYDEAFNGLDARRVLAGGYHPIYFAGNNGREPLFIYLQTLSVWLLGPTPFALRLVSGLLGILTVPVIYFTARTVLGDHPLGQHLSLDPPALPTIAALAAAAGMTVSYWHLSISRLGFRAMLLPLVSALALAFFWRGWTKGRTRDYGWSGLWFAAALYTYVAARLLPLAVILFVLTEAAVDVWQLRKTRSLLRDTWQARLKGLAVMALVGALLMAPLIWEFWTNPTLLSARTADISVFTVSQSDMPGTPAQRIVHNIGVTLGNFYTGGDQNARHNLPNRPVNDPLLAVLFTVGWLAALIRIKLPHARLILLWLVVMLAPVVLSTEAPHTLRGTGALPAVALLYGLGTYTLAFIAAWTARRLSRRDRSAATGGADPVSRNGVRLAFVVGIVLLAAILLGSGAITRRDYFDRWARLPELGEAFSLTSQLAATETARLLADPNQPEVLLPSGLYFTPQLGFAVGPIVEGDLPQTRAPSQETSPLVYRLEVESPSLALKSYYLIRNEEDQPRSTWVQMIEDAPTQAATQLSNPTTAVQPVVAPSQQPGWPHVTRDTLPTNVQLEKRKISYPLTVHFDNGVTLAGYDIARGRATPTGEEPPIYLTLFWKRTPPEHVSALDSTRSNDKQELDMGAFDVFVHLANQDGVWETNNGPIAGGYFPSSSSTTILDEVREFTVPPAMSPGKAFFEVGLYRYDPRLATSGQDRLSIVDDEGHAVADAVTLGGLWIGPEPSQADFSDLTPLGVQFDGQIELVGSRVQPKPEDPSQLDVVLGWRSLGRPASDYTAFVHLIDQNGAILSQFDQAPAGADHPSHLWAPNESARSVFPLTMPAGQDPALTRLRMGLYEPVSQKQLPVSALRESSLGAIGDTYVLVPLPE